MSNNQHLLTPPSDQWADRFASTVGNPCTSRKDVPKARYPTRELAWCAAALWRLGSGAYQHPYHCPGCGYYHLTTARGDRKPWVRAVTTRIHSGGRP